MRKVPLGTQEVCPKLSALCTKYPQFTVDTENKLSALHCRANYNL
jgi:hypothetical protein